MAESTPAKRLALALCRMDALCRRPCSDCLEQSAAVAAQVGAELIMAGFEHSAEVVAGWLPAESTTTNQKQ